VAIVLFELVKSPK